MRPSALQENRLGIISQGVKFPTIVIIGYSLMIQFAYASEINNSSLRLTMNESLRGANVVLLNHQYSSKEVGPGTVVGQVINIGNETAKSVKLFVNVYDKNGDLIEENLIYSTVGDLKPEQKFLFNITAPKAEFEAMYDYNMSIEWSDLQGHEQRIDDAKTVSEK